MRSKRPPLADRPAQPIMPALRTRIGRTPEGFSSSSPEVGSSTPRKPDTRAPRHPIAEYRYTIRGCNGRGSRPNKPQKLGVSPMSQPPASLRVRAQFIPMQSGRATYPYPAPAGSSAAARPQRINPDSVQRHLAGRPCGGAAPARSAPRCSGRSDPR